MIQLVAQMSNKAIGNGLQSSNREISDLVGAKLTRENTRRIQRRMYGEEKLYQQRQKWISMA